MRQGERKSREETQNFTNYGSKDICFISFKNLDLLKKMI